MFVFVTFAVHKIQVFVLKRKYFREKSLIFYEVVWIQVY
jgi:hypothetical protein